MDVARARGLQRCTLVGGTPSSDLVAGEFVMKNAVSPMEKNGIRPILTGQLPTQVQAKPTLCLFHIQPRAQ